MADFLLDSTTRHNIWLQRVASHEANTFDPVIQRVDKIIRDVLGSTGDRITTRKELNEIIRRIREEVGAEYSGWTDQLLEDLEAIAVNESEFTSDQLRKATGNVEIQDAPASRVWAAALAMPVQTSDKGESSLLSPFVKSFTPREINRINGAIRLGFFQGETTNDIVRRIRGTRRNKFRDGILVTTTRNAQAIARTGTNHVANVAKQAAWNANKDILTGWVFTATLDNRTTNICRFNDQTEHDLGEGPVPPLHVNCRSTQTPKIKDRYSILGRREQTTRASKGAQGGKSTTKSPYYEWLETQPRWFQEEVLGEARTQLFRQGGLTADEFRKATSNKFGEPLTLDEIRARNPDAWRDAGLDE